MRERELTKEWFDEVYELILVNQVNAWCDSFTFVLNAQLCNRVESIDYRMPNRRENTPGKNQQSPSLVVQVISIGGNMRTYCEINKLRK